MNYDLLVEKDNCSKLFLKHHIEPQNSTIHSCFAHSSICAAHNGNRSSLSQDYLEDWHSHSADHSPSTSGVGISRSCLILLSFFFANCSQFLFVSKLFETLEQHNCMFTHCSIRKMLSF